VGKDLMNEADEEHHVARMLIAELDANAAPDHRFAKFTVPAESVRHHIKEERTRRYRRPRNWILTSRRLVSKCSTARKTLSKTEYRQMPSTPWSSRQTAKATHQHKVMKEHKQGTLRSGSGKNVKSRKQAVAIALSETRKSGARVPRKKKQ
jgi:hypothetical protein